MAIFLHEALIDDAIDAVRQGYAGYDVLRQVADAAVARRPAWVIDVACKQAEDIMDQGRSQAYHYAADWLERAREAYKIAGRASEWQTYLAELKERHGRKYKLMPLLKAL